MARKSSDNAKKIEFLRQYPLIGGVGVAHFEEDNEEFEDYGKEYEEEDEYTEEDGDYTY